jgi:glycosyltransferase involved in cell wall biosynthesis
MDAGEFDMAYTCPSVGDGRSRIGLIAPGPGTPSEQGAQASTLASKLRREGFDVALLPTDPPFPNGTRWLKWLYGVDVVHICAELDRAFLSTACSVVRLAKRRGKRVVWSYCSGDASDHAMALGPWVKRIDDIVVPSQSFQRVFARQGLCARIIPAIVDICVFHYRRRAPLLPHFLSTRGFHSVHGIENTLLAFAFVRTRYPAATLTIVGAGSEEHELRQLSDALGNRGIRFLDGIEHSAMPHVYEEADVFLNSSPTNHQLTAVLDAMASGLPVITTDAGDIPTLVRDGVTGMIVPRHDPNRMANAATVLLEQAELAHTISYCAKERIESHTWSHVRDAWADVYAGRLVMSPSLMEHEAQRADYAA